MLKYLALGDSYTIGEGVAFNQNFPYQTATLLNEKYNLGVAPPEIIATTGWTTDELTGAINDKNPLHDYDLVSLLIGVNNQYRGRSIENYKDEFTALLASAIQFAKGDSRKVFVLSIPDWGVTPFATDRDRKKIALEIDAFNEANQHITVNYNCHYLDITSSTRHHGENEVYLTEDKLHYSAEEYTCWAKPLATMIAEVYGKRG